MRNRQFKRSNRKIVAVVGAFPSPDQKIYGGILSICRILKESHFSDEFEILEIDSTQKSNPAPNFLKRLFFAIIRLIKFAIIIRSKKPNSLIVFCSGLASIIEKGSMVYFAKKHGVSTLIFPRAAGVIEISKQKKIYRYFLKNFVSQADAFLCQGQAWYDFAIKDLGISSAQVKIIPNWTVTKDLSSIGSKKKYAFPLKQVNILYVGWLEWHKGIEELIKAFGLLKLNTNLNLHLTVVGKGHAEQGCKDLATQLEIADSITFAGWLERKELLHIYSISDIFVLPSWHEGLPNAMIEAMACGIPTVVTPVGNIPNYFRDRLETMFVPIKNQEAIFNSLEDLISCKETYIKLAKSGRKVALENFSAKPAIDKLISATNETSSFMLNTKNCND